MGGRRHLTCLAVVYVGLFLFAVLCGAVLGRVLAALG